MNSYLRQRSLCLWLFLAAVALCSGCADGADSDADASDVLNDGATDAAGDGSDGDGSGLPTHYFRAVAISEVLDRETFVAQGVIDFGGGRQLSRFYADLYSSDDDGETWNLIPSPFTFPNEDVFGKLTFSAQSDSVFVFSSARDLYRSDDRGETFKPLARPFTAGSGASIIELVVADDGALWAFPSRSQFSAEERGLAVSTDNGDTFESVNLPVELYETDPSVVSTFRGFFAGSSGTVFLSFNKKGIYRRSIDSDWEFIEGISLVRQLFVAAPGIVLISFHDQDSGTYNVALSTDDGQTFSIETVPGSSWYTDTFAQLDDGTLLRVSELGQLRVLSADGTSWDEVVDAYPNDHESPYVQEVKVDQDSVELTYEYELLRWTKGDHEWTVKAPPPVIPLGSAIVDITVIESGKAAVIVEKNNRSIIYVSDDGGETWRRGQRFDERVNTLAMKPEGDIIFIGGGGGRHWFLDGDGMLGPDVNPSSAYTGYGGFPLLQSVWTPKYGRNSYLLVVGANSDDSDGGFYRSPYYTSLGSPVFVDPVQDPAFPARDNPAGMHSVSYFGESGISVGMRQYVNGASRQVRVRTANVVSDWTEFPYQFYDESRPAEFATPVSMASTTGEDCTMFGQIYSDGRLYNGGFPAEIVEGLSDSVPVSGIAFNDVECGPDGALWLGTTFGLFRLERLP